VTGSRQEQRGKAAGSAGSDNHDLHKITLSPAEDRSLQ
jgi:hypothetical protein